jgi:hypothetical protein
MLGSVTALEDGTTAVIRPDADVVVLSARRLRWLARLKFALLATRRERCRGQRFVEVGDPLDRPRSGASRLVPCQPWVDGSLNKCPEWVQEKQG